MTHFLGPRNATQSCWKSFFRVRGGGERFFAPSLRSWGVDHGYSTLVSVTTSSIRRYAERLVSCGIAVPVAQNAHAGLPPGLMIFCFFSPRESPTDTQSLDAIAQRSHAMEDAPHLSLRTCADSVLSWQTEPLRSRAATHEALRDGASFAIEDYQKQQQKSARRKVFGPPRRHFLLSRINFRPKP